MTDPLLDVRDVSVHFGGVHALRQVSLVVAPGEAVGVVGPNGAGKTTLLRVVAGELRPSRGAVWFAGRPLADTAAHDRARLGIRRTFQRVEVFPELTVREHLLVAERARRGDGRLWKDLLGRGRPRPAELERVDGVLAQLDLAALAETPVAALSLGHCRLVELGRAMVAEPRLLLADEPSSGLDQTEGAAAARILRLVRRTGAAVLLVEHDLALVTEAVDRLVVLDFGELIADGPVAQVLDDPQVRRAYLGTTTC